MNDPTSASSPSAGRAAGSPHSAEATWFRSRDGRRYGIEIALIIVAKLALLAVLCGVLAYVWPRSGTPPANTVHRYYNSAAPADHHD